MSIIDAEKIKLKELVLEGVQIHDEIETLKSGLSDTVKSVAEELEIKPAVLNKAIRIAHKNNYRENRAALDEVEEILIAVDRYQ